MLAFYGWTDLQLINMVHTKDTYYKDEEADLYVLMLSRISYDLLSTIENSYVFTKVYKLTPYPHEIDTSSLSKAIKLFSASKHYKHYRAQLPQDKEYAEFFTGGLWSDARYILHSLDIKIVNFVEEGTGTYRGLKILEQCMPRSGFKEWLLRFMHFPNGNFKANKLFVYEPSLYKAPGDMEIIKLPRIGVGTLALDILRNTPGDKSIYESAETIYIAAPGEESHCDLPPSTVVHSHPMDNPSLPLEWVYANVNMSNKKLLSNYESSAFLTLKYMFDTKGLFEC